MIIGTATSVPKISISEPNESSAPAFLSYQPHRAWGRAKHLRWEMAMPHLHGQTEITETTDIMYESKMRLASVNLKHSKAVTDCRLL